MFKKITFASKGISSGGINSHACRSLSLLLFELLSSLFFIESLQERSEETLPDLLPIGLQTFRERFGLFQGEGAPATLAARWALSHRSGPVNRWHRERFGDIQTFRERRKRKEKEKASQDD